MIQHCLTLQTFFLFLIGCHTKCLTHFRTLVCFGLKRAPPLPPPQQHCWEQIFLNNLVITSHPPVSKPSFSLPPTPLFPPSLHILIYTSSGDFLSLQMHSFRSYSTTDITICLSTFPPSQTLANAKKIGQNYKPVAWVSGKRRISVRAECGSLQRAVSECIAYAERRPSRRHS